MALKISGTTVLTDNSNGSFTTVTIPSTGFIEIPDSANVTLGTMAYRTRACTPIWFADASWSWWQKPQSLRDRTNSKDFTYIGFTCKNTAVGLAITNNKTMLTNTYIIAGNDMFNLQDDHNAGVTYTGNGRTIVFFQGRCVNSAITVNNASVNVRNMFFVDFAEGAVNSSSLVSNYKNTIVQNTSFNYEAASVATDTSYYPNILVSNNKFVLIGRQTANSSGGSSGANNWNFVTCNWPLTGNTLAQPRGFFKSSKWWPYFAISRSPVNKDKFVFCLGWHPVSTNYREKHLYYGYINRTSTTPGEAWDVYTPGSLVDTVYGTLSTSGWTPLNENNLELAVINKANGSSATSAATGENGYMRVRLFDVSENAIAYSVFSNNYVTTCNPTGAGNTVNKVNISSAFVSTSTTAVAIGTGAKSIVVSGGIYIGGQPITIRYDNANYMKGYVTSFDLTSFALGFTVTAAYGAGTYSSWTVDGTSTLDNYYTSWVLRSSNTFLPNVATITAYDGTTKLATLETAFNVAPKATDTITLSGNNVSEYRVAYKLITDPELSSYSWVTKRVCTGGRDFTGGAPANYASGTLDAREYLGSMTFSRTTTSTSNTTLTICREVANTWYAEDIQINNLTDMVLSDYETYDAEFGITTPGKPNIAYTVMSTVTSPVDFIYQRPHYEMLSEDSMIYNSTGNTRVIMIEGYHNKRDYEDFTSNATSARASDFIGNTVSTTKSNFNNFNVTSYIELTSPTATSGYAAGGLVNITLAPTEPGYVPTIDKFPFASDTNATDVGDLVTTVYGNAGCSSTINGYSCGGQVGPVSQPAQPYTAIERFSFVTGLNATQSGELSEERRFVSGHSSSTYGYVSAGLNASPSTAFVDTIDKFPFTGDANSSDVGNLTQARSTSGGSSSSTYGYATGGVIPAPTGSRSAVIDKFPFASDTNATSVGNLTAARTNLSGHSDPSGGYGYAAGGYPPPGTAFVNTIERYPYSSDASATSVGSLSAAKRWGTGTSATSYGYYGGGDTGPAPTVTVISSVDKFAFSSSTSGTNVLNLTTARYGAAPAQG